MAVLNQSSNFENFKIRDCRLSSFKVENMVETPVFEVERAGFTVGFTVVEFRAGTVRLLGIRPSSEQRVIQGGSTNLLFGVGFLDSRCHSSSFRSLLGPLQLGSAMSCGNQMRVRAEARLDARLLLESSTRRPRRQLRTPKRLELLGSLLHMGPGAFHFHLCDCLRLVAVCS